MYIFRISVDNVHKNIMLINSIILCKENEKILPTYFQLVSVEDNISQNISNSTSYIIMYNQLL